MISHTHKFILILPPKTASTSLVTTLKDFIYITGIKDQPEKFTFDFYEGGETARKHARLCSYDEKYVKEYKLYGVIRNPWDRVVSWFNYRNKRAEENNELGIYTLEEYLDNLSPVHRLLYSEFFDVDYETKYDFKTIRFENLNSDFEKFCADVNLPNLKLEHVNASTHKHYTEYYDDKTRKIVAEIYAEDIEKYGYKFGEDCENKK